jgi:hypothetical protein
MLDCEVVVVFLNLLVTGPVISDNVCGSITRGFKGARLVVARYGSYSEGG